MTRNLIDVTNHCREDECTKGGIFECNAVKKTHLVYPTVSLLGFLL